MIGCNRTVPKEVDMSKIVIDMENIQVQLLQLFLAADRQAANNLIDDWAKTHGYKHAVLEVMTPALEKFGELWASKEDISLAQGYIAAKIAEDVMAKLKDSLSAGISVSETKGPVVIGNIEDDYHALGRKLVTTFLRTAGWSVYDLGTDIPAADFVDKALEVNARIIAASAMMYTTAMNIKKLREEIDRRGLTASIRLAVGGAVFRLRPELVEEVGGDGTAANAVTVPELMETLLKSVTSAGGGK